jgi:hypothetical protein
LSSSNRELFVLQATNAYVGYFELLCEAEELHVIRTPNRNSVTNILGVDALNLGTINSPGVSTLRVVGLRAHRLAVVVLEYTSPLLHRLLVVLGFKRRIRATMVDLHARPVAIVPRVHGEDDVGPSLRSSGRLAVGASAVPGVDATGGRGEAAGSYTGVDDGGFEKFGVGGGHDVLESVSMDLGHGEGSGKSHTVIMAPLLDPVTKTLEALALYSDRVHLTMLAMVLESPPPLWLSVALELTSQQVPEWGDDG